MPYADVAIEFSTPETAFANITQLLEKRIPVVCGTTGWLHYMPEVKDFVDINNTAFFYASNFSLGVNLFFELNRKLAKLMKEFPDYEVNMTEVHHIHKKDAPSGTALSLVQDILPERKDLKGWSLEPEQNKLHIEALREGEVPGTHIVKYQSNLDLIEIKHEAFSRQGFAQGAVIAAEWLQGKKGMFDMKDLLNL